MISDEIKNKAVLLCPENSTQTQPNSYFIRAASSHLQIP